MKLGQFVRFDDLTGIFSRFKSSTSSNYISKHSLAIPVSSERERLPPQASTFKHHKTWTVVGPRMFHCFNPCHSSSFGKFAAHNDHPYLQPLEITVRSVGEHTKYFCNIVADVSRTDQGKCRDFAESKEVFPVMMWFGISETMSRGDLELVNQ